jgi:ABC-type Zn uptake system ZnuABC Zn-binding protein ZnuA/ABC-type Mn2+/Zn2+ transport system permease subunit
VEGLTAPFELPYVQRGLAEVLLLSAGAGVLGCWIVLRGLSFYSHAVGTAAFPGLVLADGLGFAAPLGALAAAAAFALLVAALGGRDRLGPDVATGLGLAGMLAVGVILASDVFASGAGVESLLFGSLLLVEPRDLAIAGAASAAAVAASLLLGRAWLASGFDRGAATALGVHRRTFDAVLLGLTAVIVTAALTALGALLVSALVVVPAATVRLWTSRLPAWQAATVALVALEGTAGLWLSVKLNAPPGATIATLAGAVFAAAAAARAATPRVRRLTVAVALGAVLVLVPVACGSDSSGSDRPRVVATTTQLGDWLRVVGGDDFDVHQLLSPNTDPHEYEPRPADVESLAGAKLILKSGGDLDGWVDGAADDAGSDARVVDVGAGLATRREGSGDPDPHWWHDPRKAARAVDRIGLALAQVRPAAADRVARREAHYLRDLRRLDAGIATCMAAVPRAQRKLVTDHDALGYFAARYGIEVVGAAIPARTTGAQPSAGELAALVKTIEREHVRAVFPEASVNSKVAETLARETGVTARYELYGDTLGPKGSSGDTYLKMEAANADAMVKGFTGGRRGCGI